jgi:SAM-dependent methyltransferase
MSPRACPVCRTDASSAALFMRRHIDPGRLDALSFASRKTPEFMCHELRRCPACDLVYAPEPPAQSELAEAYHAAEFDSAQEADDAAAAYGLALGPLLQRLDGRGAALEIGTGTGVFLDVLRGAGFRQLVGIEPSAAAIAAAPEHRRDWIRHGIFRETDFAPASFDLICCFMTLEHVRDPQDVVQGAVRLLRPGGALACVVHDHRAWINRLLGARSPIIDIEHMQLFSPRSAQALLTAAGCQDLSVHSFRNRYALRYWTRLLPLPGPLKSAGLRTLEALRLADRHLSANVGNLLVTGWRS